jgi:sulfhydrogenase subunit alpha
VVRAVEVVCALEEAIRLIEGYWPPAVPSLPVQAQAGQGHGVSEAPRALLYQRYELDADGTILSARIVPPTAQNQAAIEQDLGRVVQARLGLDDDILTRLCEQAILNYDPCISGATTGWDRPWWRACAADCRPKWTC